MTKGIATSDPNMPAIQAKAGMPRMAGRSAKTTVDKAASDERRYPHRKMSQPNKMPQINPHIIPKGQP